MLLKITELIQIKLILEISQSTEQISKPQYPQDATLIWWHSQRGFKLSFIQQKQENTYCLQHQNDGEIDQKPKFSLATDILVTSIQWDWKKFG